MIKYRLLMLAILAGVFLLVAACGGTEKPVVEENPVSFQVNERLTCSPKEGEVMTIKVIQECANNICSWVEKSAEETLTPVTGVYKGVASNNLEIEELSYVLQIGDQVIAVSNAVCTASK